MGDKTIKKHKEEIINKVQIVVFFFFKRRQVVAIMEHLTEVSRVAAKFCFLTFVVVIIIH